MSRRRQPAQHGDDAVVRVNQPVVMQELVFPVAAEQPVGLRLVAGGVLQENALEWPADGGAPFVVRGCGTLKPDEGVSSLGEDKLDGVDERAVEVEKKGRQHGSMLRPVSAPWRIRSIRDPHHT